MVRLRHLFQGRKPDLEALQNFTARGDRDDTPFFAGRNEEIARIDRLCAHALARARDGETVQGATQLFRGAPGAGKTALLCEMARRWAGRKNRRGDANPIAVQIHFLELANEATVTTRITEAVDPTAERDNRRMKAPSISGQGGKPGMGSDRGTNGARIASPVLSFHELRRRFPPPFWARPVCLMVDEIQNVDSTARDVLNSMQEGQPGLPIVPVLAGLGNSYDIVSDPDVGLMRLEIDAVRDVEALAPDEGRQAVEAMLSECRVDRTGAGEDWPALLSERSDGWPQHLHNGMRALAVELVRVRGKLADVDSAAVLERESDYRQRAYLACISPQMKGARRLIAAVLTALPEEGAPRDVLKAEIERQSRTCAGEDPDNPTRQLPDDMSSESFLNHLVRRGALQRGSQLRYACPIPSFRRFLIEYGAKDYGAAIKVGDPVGPETDDSDLPEP